MPSKAADHVLEPLVNGFDFAVDRHTGASVSQYDDRQRASGLTWNFLSSDIFIRP